MLGLMWLCALPWCSLFSQQHNILRKTEIFRDYGHCWLKVKKGLSLCSVSIFDPGIPFFAVSIAGFSSSPLDAMSGMHEGDVLGRRALRSLDPCFYRLLAHHNTTSMGGRLLRSSLLPCSPIRTPPVKVPKKLPLNTSYAVSIHQ